MTNRFCLLPLAAILAMASLTPAAAQEEGGGPRKAAPDYPAPQSFPHEDKAQVAIHLSRARKLAGTDLFPDMAHRCIISPMFPRRVQGIQYNGKITPTRIFDNLYSVGQNEVSAFALDTSGGIILFDALSSADEAEHLLIPNMVALGLNPARIRYVVVTHAHGDHYGGAKFIQDRYGAKAVASAIDWDEMGRAFSADRGPFRNLPIPRRDIAMADGETLTLGDTTIRFYVTPGHTPGTLSAIFTVRDRGVAHVVGFHGGTGGGRDPAALRTSIPAFERWERISKAAGADTLISNHPLHSESLEKEEIVRHRLPGDTNPFVIGRSAYQRYVAIQAECARVQLARMGMAEAGDAR